MSTLENRLRERCGYWQHRLRLLDWDVEVRVRRWRDMEHEDALAYVQVFHPKKAARIIVCDPADKHSDDWPDEPLERTLVHELLHLHIHPFNPRQETAEWTAMEQAVHAIAGALLESYEAGVDLD